MRYRAVGAMMGTNATGCTEWERDFDTMTEQPRIPICENGHQLDYPNQLCNICLKPMAKEQSKIKQIPTDDLARETFAGLLRCRGSKILCQELLAFLIRELRNEEHPQRVQDALNAAEAEERGG